MKKTPTQAERVLAYLEQGLTINRLQGWDYLGVLELPARITELRQKGYPIETKMISVTNRFGEAVRVAEWSLVRKEG